MDTAYVRENPPPKVALKGTGPPFLVPESLNLFVFDFLASQPDVRDMERILVVLVWEMKDEIKWLNAWRKKTLLFPSPKGLGFP